MANRSKNNELKNEDNKVEEDKMMEKIEDIKDNEISGETEDLKLKDNEMVEEVIEDFGYIEDEEEEKIIEEDREPLIVEKVKARTKEGKLAKSQSTGEQLYNYILKGKVRGREKKVEFTVTDVGGYENLKDVFYNINTAMLNIITETNIVNNQKRTIRRYEVFNKFEDEIVYKAQVKLRQQSDRDTLDNILNTLKAEMKKASA